MNFSSEHIALQTAYIPASPNLYQLELSTQPASFCHILHRSSGFWGPPLAGQDLWLPVLFPEHARRCHEQKDIWFLLTIVWQKIRTSGKYTLNIEETMKLKPCSDLLLFER